MATHWDGGPILPLPHQVQKFILSFRVRGIYQVTHRIGGRSDVVVFRAFNMLTGSEVAIKLEDEFDLQPFMTSLAYEAQIYKLIPDGTEGFPCIHYMGPDADCYVIIMDKLGPSLAALRRVCREAFTMRTVCMLALQMLDRIEFLHSRGIVRCDIKPHNFAMGDGENAQIVHMFDFGLAKTYLDPATGKHIPFSQGHRHAIGTVRYASVAAHNKHSVSRRDDIESLLYVLLEFYHGRLPWKGLPAPDWDGKVIKVGELKADLAPSSPLRLLLDRSPPEFTAFLEHCLSLPYGRTPDYALLRALFRERMKQEGWACDWRYDWMDGSAPRGTLLPEEYVLTWDLVKENNWDPTYM